jgi:leucyl-tRNA synthetase
MNRLLTGACERCGTPVVRRFLTQWFFRITKYAEELLNDLDKLDWPEKTKIMQRNWIGKSVGAEIDFEVADTGDKFTVFTTRPDTIYGATYVVLAPEHPLVDKITKPEYKEQVQAYLDFVAHETEIERTSTEKEKTGVFTGSYAINPATKEKIPIWIADYVLIHYGTGAVMGVPAHDERDFEFAKKFGLPIRKVILQPGTKPEDELESAYVEPGIMINSGEYNGMSSEEAWDKIVDDLASEGVARRSVKYRLRDWLISRQRYWGAPIPIVYCEKCGEVPVPEEQLPVLLPYNVDFKPTGESPLARCEEFINTTCPKCGAPAKRDPDTMDTFVDSSWYYLRYLSPHLDSAPFDKELVKIWCPVDKYVGGAEHATMHLLYARFITKALRDAGYLEFDEPFISLYHQGTITNKGAKMSKSKGNVVNPDDFVSKYGSDVFRLYLMFMGRYDEGGDWSDEGINGMWRFVNRVYNFVLENKDVLRSFKPKDKYEVDELGDYARAIYRKTHKTSKKVTADIDTFNFNTAIASLMELFNLLSEFDANLYDDFTKEVFVHCVKRFIIMLGPLAPHLAEELWEISGENESLFVGSKWVEPDEKALVEEEVTIVAQVNGKVRARIKVPIDLDDETLKNIVLNDASVQKYVGGKKISKIVVVKNKLVSIACEDN